MQLGGRERERESRGRREEFFPRDIPWTAAEVFWDSLVYWLGMY